MIKAMSHRFEMYDLLMKIRYDKGSLNLFHYKTVQKLGCREKIADLNLPPLFRHGFVTVLPWETLAGEKAGESVLPKSKI